MTNQIKSTHAPASRKPHSTKAESVFARVLQLLQQNGSSNVPSQQWLKQDYTISDVQEEIKRAQEKYKQRPQGKVRKWLANFSSGVLYYGQIMDVLVQHHPEYVSLAWGTTKLLFVLFQNHEELLTGLAKILTKVSGVLPQIEIQLELYDERLMQQAVEKVYGSIIELFHEMVKFYEESPLKHAWKSFSKPLSIRFAPLIDAIDEQSQFIRDFASALAKKEQRSMYKLMQLMGKEMSLMGKDMSVMAIDVSRLAEAFISAQSITKNTLTKVSDLQAAKMISETRSDDFSEPSATLDSRLLFCRRHQARQQNDIDVLWKSLVLKHWSCSTTSAIILIQGFANKDIERMLLGTAMVDYVRHSPIPVLWALQALGGSKFAPTSIVQLLKHLTMQVLRSRGSTVEDQVSPEFNATRIASASTAEHWTDILKHALSGTPLVYIVVDLNLLNQVEDLFTSIMRLIAICKPIKFKFALISRRRLARADYKSSSTAVLDVDKAMSSGPRASLGQTRCQPSAGMRRSAGRGASAFCARLN